jgi:hypothetical protein
MGVSTGVGPVGYYTGLGGSTRRRSTGTATANRQLAAAVRTQAKLEKVAEAERLIQAFTSILELHREEFPLATPPAVPPPPPVSLMEIQRRRRTEAKRATSIFARQERRQALANADQLAIKEAAQLSSDLAEQTAKYQAEADAWWASMNRCEPDTVLVALAKAFEDNEAAAAAVGVEGSETTLIVVVPSDSAIPERKATTTVAGNLSLKKLTKRETADFYKLLVCGYLLVTLREAFAVVPALQSARIVAVRPSDKDAYGKRHPEVIAAVTCERSALNGVQWSDVDAVRVVNDCCTERMLVQKGVTSALQPIKLDDEPELRALLDTVDMSELLET